MTHSKSAHAGVRFYSTVSCMAGAPTPIHGCAFPMGTPVTPPCRITPITNLGIREASIEPLRPAVRPLAFCGWFKKRNAQFASSILLPFVAPLQLTLFPEGQADDGVAPSSSRYCHCFIKVPPSGNLHAKKCESSSTPLNFSPTPSPSSISTSPDSTISTSTTTFSRKTLPCLDAKTGLVPGIPGIQG